MLESVRENLKGTLVIVVIIIFIVPMVISGVGSSYIGGVAGTDAGSVNGKAITEVELSRAINTQRSRMTQQGGLDASSPYLSDENLRGPVLDRLSRRAALVTEGEAAGMAVSDAAFGKILAGQQEFITDGKFDQQKYRLLLAQARFTPSSYKQEVISDLILNQQATGLQLSAFSTQAEFQQLVKLTHQKRSFYSVKIPLDQVKDGITVDDEELNTYYQANSAQYAVPEKVSVEYVELSLDQLATAVDVADEDVVAQYQAEIENFVSDETYSVAHILLEEGSAEKTTEVAEKLAAGEAFETLAENYSDDIATNMDGGNLGVLTRGMFPAAFEEAVLTLKEGEVSEAVVTDAGTHFIKVTKIEKVEIPTLESRRDAIKAEIAKALAQDTWSENIELLGELTFTNDGLTEAASQLGLTVTASSLFDRNTGSGIASNAKVREAAFSDDILVSGHNSSTIELSPERYVVLRLKDRKEAYTKPLEEVKVLVEARVKEEKTAGLLAGLADEFKASVIAGADAKTVAEEKNFSFAAHDAAKRSDIAVDQEVAAIAFTAAKPNTGEITYVSQSARDGGYLLVALSDVTPGSVSDLEEAEKQGFLAQISREAATFDGSVYEAAVVESAEIKLN